MTPRLSAFLEILLSEDKAFGREEVKNQLFKRHIGADIGQTRRYLSNLSQFLTKESNAHLRQVVEFDSGGKSGEMKDNYHLLPQYREMLKRLIEEGRQTGSADRTQ